MLRTGLLLCALTAFEPAAWGQVREFSVQTKGRSMVQFVSNAPLEKIIGKTESVTGTARLNLSSLISDASGRIEVPLTTLDTGLSLRNEHMRENHLETKLHPQAVFELESVLTADPANISAGGASEVLFRGELELHGVKKTYDVPGRIVFDAGTGALTVQANWSIALKDHEISRPEFLFMKLSETQKLSVELDMTTP